MTRRYSLRACEDSATTAIAKLAPRSNPEDVCGLGMERIVSRLARLIGAPVPEVWLESHENEPAAIVRRVPRVLNWQTAAPAALAKIENNAELGVGVVLDVWTANCDRFRRNLLLEPLPVGTQFSQADQYAGWLIDHGQCGLLWAWKFDAALGPRDVDQIDPSGGVLPAAELRCRQAMPQEYKSAYWAMDEDDRDEALDGVRGVPDDAVDEIVDEVPDAYMSQELRDKTKILLKDRRDEIDRLVKSCWP